MNMFDNAPTNLPFEPAPPEAGGPSAPAPQKPVEAPIPLVANKTKKEPEDIFAGIEKELDAEKQLGKVLEPAPSSMRGLKIVALIFGVLVLVGVIGAAFWFFVINKPVQTDQTQAETTSPTPTPLPVEQPPVIEQPVVPVTFMQNIPTPEPITQPIPEPPVVAAAPVEGLDTDADYLTDTEEMLYGSNSAVKDTDGDGYDDGKEVAGVYSPLAKSQGLASDPSVTRQVFGNWTLLVPKNWTFEVAGPSATIKTASDSTFTLTESTLPVGQDLLQWVKSLYPNIPNIDYFELSNGYKAVQAPYGQTVYVAMGDKALTFKYDLNGDTAYEYRISYKMMVTSLSYTAQR